MANREFQLLEPDNMAAMSTPFRQQLLAALTEPDSAINLARRFDMSRQRIGYHMRELEKSGCIELAGERQRRGLTERLYQVRPLAFVCGPQQGASDIADDDRFSWSALLSLLAGALWDLVRLRRLADSHGQRLATLALGTEITVASPRARRAFAEDLVSAIEAVVSKHHDPESASGRSFRLLVGAFPKLEESSRGESGD